MKLEQQHQSTAAIDLHGCFCSFVSEDKQLTEVLQLHAGTEDR